MVMGADQASLAVFVSRVVLERERERGKERKGKRVCLVAKISNGMRYLNWGCLATCTRVKM